MYLSPECGREGSIIDIPVIRREQGECICHNEPYDSYAILFNLFNIFPVEQG